MASANPKIRSLSGRKAALIRHGGDTTAITVDLATEQMADYVARVVASAPPLSPEQRDRIAALLRCGAVGGEAA